MNPTILVRGTLLVFGLCCSLLSRVGPAEAVPFSEFVDPNPAPGNQFGAVVVALSTGNVVITSPYDDAEATDAGAVYLFNGATGALISRLLGSTDGDRIGSGGVRALSGGNYVISSPFWDKDGAADAGAATWGHGTTGVDGAVSAANSLVGSTADDRVSSRGVLPLTNGNYVVMSDQWDKADNVDVGSVTWGDGATGVTGVVSTANSLIGSTAQDRLPVSGFALTNGNYVVTTDRWDNGAVVDAGAATWGNGATGTIGVISVANSLIGSTSSNQIGSYGVAVLSNGNYVVLSGHWDNGGISNVGAATWGNGTTGVIGIVGPGNSVIGSSNSDGDAVTGTALTNGNFVICWPSWSNGVVVRVGAVTWGNGSTGTIGIVSAANSLVGSKNNDQVGYHGATALTNGHYVVASMLWDDGATLDVGAATWGNGASGTTGVVSAANSLVGSSTDDLVSLGGGRGALALANGNYVVLSSRWDSGATPNVGAATWGNGATGTTGVVSAANSLVGSTASDQVGWNLPMALTNGNYVILSPYWNSGATADVGAATWCDGTVATSAVVSPANSLIGSSFGDNIGNLGGRALTNGNYVVLSKDWDREGPVVDAGAATWCSGTAATSLVVNDENSLVGRVDYDFVGRDATALSNGNYVIASARWDNSGLADAGAATWGDGATGIGGPVKPANSIRGLTANTALGTIVEEPVNGYFIAPFAEEDGGKVRVGPLANLVGVEDTRNLPAIRLLAPAPNPSMGGSRIAAVFPARDRISLVLVDVHGRAVRTLAKDEEVEAGEWSIQWDARDRAGKPVPAGIYFLRLTTRVAEVTRRLSVVR